jgi:phytoene dehydrogenase-like protein
MVRDEPLGCSPPGTSIVSIIAFHRAGARRDVNPQNYVKVKNKIASDLIANFEKAIGVSVREHIEEIAVATPQAFARYTGAYDGIVCGYETEPWDSVLPRMMMLLEDQHFDGRQFCGGYAFRWVGYSSAIISGQVAALLTLQDIGREEL